MAEYIEKQLVLSKSQQDYLEGRYDYDDFVLVSDIESIPPADVRPVVRGRWLTTDAFPHRIYCSICYKTYIPNDRWQIWVDGDLPRDFCPNCGADMRGGDNDGRIHY